MNDFSRNVLAGAVVTGIVLIGVFIIVAVFKYNTASLKEYREQKRNTFTECVEKGNELDWCYDNFIN